MTNYIKPFDIDLVYLWVDGNDTQWVGKKKKFLKNEFSINNEATSQARNANNDELKYSLRSADKYAPWIRKVFIVTDGQVPEWLNLKYDRVEIVDIRKLIPPDALPCYNSVIIEHFLYIIPGLSERFLYANDDMFFNSPVSSSFFYTNEGLPIVRLQRALGGKWINKFKKRFKMYTNIYRKTIDKAALLVEKKFGTYYSGIPHHNIDAYLKSDYKNASFNVFKDEIKPTINHHIRSENDIQRIIYLYYALVINHAKLSYTGRSISSRIRIHKTDFMDFLVRYNPVLFCLNDSHHASEADRKKIEPFLETLFPEKCAFEK